MVDIVEVENLLKELIDGHPYPKKLLTGWENGHAILNAFRDLQAESADFKQSIEQMCNDLWSLLYPNDPTGWEYRTQPLVHIRVELNQLQAENARLRDELASFRAMTCFKIGPIDDGVLGLEE